MMPVPAGSFLMGSGSGEFDERPVHRVVISRSFWMAATDVTNRQYEQFDPDHRQWRGTDGISTRDDEAVVFVSHDDAERFCQWLSAREGKPYRLPTEAEWEYACRAGTQSGYNTGQTLPAAMQINPTPEWRPKPALLQVGRRPPNAWGLFDMHGLVEQWCEDWYGPYELADATDPVGRQTSDFRVSRGGSFNTPVYFLRSAARFGDVPSDRSWLIGFRVVQAPPPASQPLSSLPPRQWATDVSQQPFAWAPGAEMSRPYFAKPVSYLNIPPGSNGPMYWRHNHCPSIAACPNGDLLVTFYSCNDEPGRELTVLATRLRRGASQWDADDVFYKAPGRNMHATAIWWDGQRTLYHFQGLSVSHGWQSLALLMRTSTDNGATWSPPHWIDRQHRLRNMPIARVIRTDDGSILLPCDASTTGNGGTAIHISHDGGATWTDPGGTIAGIHANVVELTDGRWMALGRGDSIDGRMPMSISLDQGRTWTYAPSPFPPITGGQRLALLRLKEGPLLLMSFANGSGMDLADDAGRVIRGHGLFAALSDDDGKTWNRRKLLTPGNGAFFGGGWTGNFTTDATHAEPAGYLAAVQTPDGMIQLVSSGLYYRFNLAWLKRRFPT
jgi:formylglycine-generating enzyme